MWQEIDFVNRFFVEKSDIDIPRMARLTYRICQWASAAGIFNVLLGSGLAASGSPQLLGVGIICGVLGAVIIGMSGVSCAVQILMFALLWEKRMAHMDEVRRMQVEDL